MKSISNKHKNTKKIWLTGIIVIVVLLLGYTAYAATSNSWPFENTSPNSDTEQVINYDPPTDTEVSNSQDGKKNSADPVLSPSDGAMQDIDIELSYAGQAGNSLDIRAFTSDVIEGTGTCTATVTHGETSITKTSSGFIDATSTICEPIAIPLSELTSSSKWVVQVNYTSPTSKGASDTMEVNL